MKNKRSRYKLRMSIGIAQCFSVPCAAAGTLELYGLNDVALRYETRADANRRSRFEMVQGPISPSRIGMRGEETLGGDYAGGLRAFFKLEAGYQLRNGTHAGNRLFNRFAFVGLSSGRYGSLAFGKQSTPAFDALASEFDPMTIANYNGNSWLPGALTGGLFIDNAIKYHFDRGGVQVDAMYSFDMDSIDSGGASTISTAKQRGASLRAVGVRYKTGPLGIAAGVQEVRQATPNGPTHKRHSAHLAATYTVLTTTLTAGYLHSRDASGFVDARMNAATSSLPATAYAGTARVDNGYFVGATWVPDTRWRVIGVWYYDRMRDAAYGFNTDDAIGRARQGAPGAAAQSLAGRGRGQRHSWVLYAQYAMSSRLRVYGTVDYQRAWDSARGGLPDRSQQFGAAVGIQHTF